MTPLPTTFVREGFTCTVLKRVGDVALVKVGSNPACDHHEVVKVRKVKDHTFPNGKITPAHEAMPSASQWGTFGWSYTNLKAAEAKFEALVEGSTQKRPARAA